MRGVTTVRRNDLARSSLRGRTVVVTGASSGIGRATATYLGQHGVRIVLASRDEGGMGLARDAIVEAGGEALVVPTDVSHPEQMRQLAEQAIRWSDGNVFGWVNNAGVGTYGYIDQFSAEELRRLFEVNLLGQVYGSRMILPHLIERGVGVIVNVGSILGEVPFPAMAPYVASKFAVRGFTESIRLELKTRAPGIRVCLVEPASISTLFYQHALSRMGVMPRPVWPVFRPQRVAAHIAGLLAEPRPTTTVPRIGSMLTLAHRLAPGGVQWLLARRGLAMIRSDRPDIRSNNLFEPSHGSTLQLPGFPGA